MTEPTPCGYCRAQDHTTEQHVPFEGRGTSCTCEAANDLATWHNGRCALYQEGRVPSCFICDKEGPLRPGQGGLMVCVEPCQSGRVASRQTDESERSKVSTHGPDVSALPDAASGRSPSPEKDGTLWVHGLPARSFRQVAGYLSGDAHDQSKVQVYVGGRFYDVVIREDRVTAPARTTSSEETS